MTGHSTIIFVFALSRLVDVNGSTRTQTQTIHALSLAPRTADVVPIDHGCFIR
jgi:hypothetical protein